MSKVYPMTIIMVDKKNTSLTLSPSCWVFFFQIETDRLAIRTL